MNARFILLLLLTALVAGAGRAETGDKPDSVLSVANWLNAPVTPDAGTVSTSTSQDLRDPFAVVSTDSMWQTKYGLAFVRPIDDSLSFTYETNATAIEATTSGDPTASTALDEGSPYTAQKAALRFQPATGVSLAGDMHQQQWDAASAALARDSSGLGFSATTPLLLNSKLMLGMTSDRGGDEALNSATTEDNAYQAEFDQPLGKMPLTAVLKGRYEETDSGGSLLTRLPSLEQSLTWKPVEGMALSTGLRQQQYENLPGVTEEMNEALFADWSQTLAPDVTWHSYAEMLNARSQSMISPTSSGANGTPQANAPGQGTGLSTAVPLSTTDQRMTFSTGPSFKIEKDISASVEYSSRWDQNPTAGSGAQEQRVSVSLKGTF